MPISLKTMPESSLTSAIVSRSREIRLDLKYSLLFAFKAESIADLSRDALILLYKIVFSLSSYQEMRQSGRTKYFYLGVDFKGKPIGCLKNSFTKGGARRIFFLIDPKQNTITLVSAALMSGAGRDHSMNAHIQNYFTNIFPFLKSHGLSWDDFQSRTIEDIWPETEIEAESASVNEEELGHEQRSQLHQLSETLERLTDHLYHEEFSARRFVNLLQCFSRLITLKKQSAKDANLDTQIEQTLLRSAFLFFKIFDISDILIHFDCREGPLQLVYNRGNKTQRHDIVSDDEKTPPNEIVSELLSYTEDFLTEPSVQSPVEQSEEDEVKHSDELILSIESEQQLSNFAHCVYGSWFMIPETALRLTREHLSAYPPQNRDLLFSLLKYPDKLILHSESVLFLIDLILGNDKLVHFLPRESARHLLTMAVSQNILTREQLKTCFEKLEPLTSLACLKQINEIAEKNGVALPPQIQKKLSDYRPPELPGVKEALKVSASSSAASGVETAQQEEVKNSIEGTGVTDTLNDIQRKVTTAIPEKNKKKKIKYWSDIKETLRDFVKKHGSLPSGMFRTSFLKSNSMSLYGLAYHHVKGNIQLLTLLEEQAKHLSPEDRNNFFKSALTQILKTDDWKTFERLLLCGFELEDGNVFFEDALAKVFKKSDWKTFERLLLCGFQAENYRYGERTFFGFILDACFGFSDIKFSDSKLTENFIKIVNIFINSLESLGESENRLQDFINLSLYYCVTMISSSGIKDTISFFNKVGEHLIASGADPNAILQKHANGYTLDLSIMDSAIIAEIKRSLLESISLDFKIPVLLLPHGALPLLGVNSLLYRSLLERVKVDASFYQKEYKPYIDNLVEEMKSLVPNSSLGNDERLGALSGYNRQRIESMPISLGNDERLGALSGYNRQLIESIPISLRNHPILIQWEKSFKLNPAFYLWGKFDENFVHSFDRSSIDTLIFYMATALHLSLLFRQEELTRFLLIHFRGVHTTLQPDTAEKLVECFGLPWTKNELSNATYLLIAALTGDKYSLGQFLDKGVDLHLENAEGKTAKMIILEKLAQLIEQKKSENPVEQSQALQAEIETYRSMLFTLLSHESKNKSDEMIDAEVDEILANFNGERPRQTSPSVVAQSIFTQQNSRGELSSTSSSSVFEKQDSQSQATPKTP